MRARRPRSFKRPNFDRGHPARISGNEASVRRQTEGHFASDRPRTVTHRANAGETPAVLQAPLLGPRECCPHLRKRDFGPLADSTSRAYRWTLGTLPCALFPVPSSLSPLPWALPIGPRHYQSAENPSASICAGKRCRCASSPSRVSSTITACGWAPSSTSGCPRKSMTALSPA